VHPGGFFRHLSPGMLENTLSGPPALILYMIFAMATILWKMEPIPVNADNSQPIAESSIRENDATDVVFGPSTPAVKT